ncbi:MAG TPA: alkaline phosphatase family protein [Polyangiaceae bacterium]
MRAIWLAAALTAVSCAGAPAKRGTVTFAVAAPATAEPRASSVVLVTLDGTRWQDVFFGDEMPTLRRWMTKDGVTIGAPGHGEMWASGPNYVSLPGYTEIFTGRPSACQSNECAATRAPTLVDEVLDCGGDAAVVSSWERIERAATRDPARAVLSTGRHETGRVDGLDGPLLARARDTNPWPGGDDYRPDALTAELALDLVQTHQPRFLFVGLGDTDEYAHHGDRAAYLAAMRAADHFIGALEERVNDDTVVFVTADHGRSDGFRDHGEAWPESGRVWMVARGAAIAARGPLDVSAHLADIAPTVRCLLGMPPDEAPNAGLPIAPICEDR